jgi:hypothetical protein
MFKLKYFTAILIAVAGLGFQQAQAHLLDPFEFQVNHPFGSPLGERIYLQNNGGGSYQPAFLPATSQFLFKQNNDGTTAGLFGQYFSVMMMGNMWMISWDLTNSGFTLDGALIKDGNLAGGGQLYSFYGISDDETVIGSGMVMFASMRNISHISFFGSPTGQQVPDGGTTAMLLGAGLGALGMVRRFLKK